jgi:hypothetical protein
MRELVARIRAVHRRRLWAQAAAPEPESGPAQVMLGLSKLTVTTPLALVLR